MIPCIRRPGVMVIVAMLCGAVYQPEELSAEMIPYVIDAGYQAVWSGTFQVANPSLPIGTGSTSSPTASLITAHNDDYSWSFNAASYSLSPESAYGSPIVRWENSTGSAFFEVSSQAFYDFVAGGGTWNSVRGQSFPIVVTTYTPNVDVASLATDGGSLVFPIPEPATGYLILAGLACVGCSGLWRRRPQQAPC